MAFLYEISFIHLDRRFGTTPPLIFTPSRVAFSTTRDLRSHRTRERLTPLESSEDLYIEREIESERARGKPERVPSSSEADFDAGVNI